jgi:hypothetical protein
VIQNTPVATGEKVRQTTLGWRSGLDREDLGSRVRGDIINSREKSDRLIISFLRIIISNNGCMLESVGKLYKKNGDD